MGVLGFGLVKTDGNRAVPAQPLLSSDSLFIMVPPSCPLPICLDPDLLQKRYATLNKKASL